MPVLGQISFLPFTDAPDGWKPADGSQLPVKENLGLFTLFGTLYGGDGVDHFCLPNLMGRVPVGLSDGQTIGEIGGAEQVTLDATTMPVHNHSFNAVDATADLPAAGDALFAVPPVDSQGNPTPIYAELDFPVTLGSNSIGFAGGGEAHPNMQPFLVLTPFVAVKGDFPSRQDPK